MKRKWIRPPWWAIVVGLGVALVFGRLVRPCVEVGATRLATTSPFDEELQYDDVVEGDASLSLPAAWPHFLPLYPGSTIRKTARISNGNGVLVEAHSPGTDVAVLAFCKLRLEAEGFKMDPGLLRNRATFRSGKRTVIVDVFPRGADGATLKIVVWVDK